MILEKYFPVVMKISRTYFIVLAIRLTVRLSLRYDMSSLSRLLDFYP